MTPAAASLPLTPGMAEGYARLALANIAREYPTKLDHFINGPDDLRAPSALHPVFHGSFDWHSCVHAHWMLARLLRVFPDMPSAEAVRAAFDSRLTAENVAGELAYLAGENRGSFVRTYGWAWLLKLAEELGRGADRDDVVPAEAGTQFRSDDATSGTGLRRYDRPGAVPARAGTQLGAGDTKPGTGVRRYDSLDGGSAHAGSHFGRWRDTLAPLADAFTRMYLEYLPRARVPLRYGIHPNSAFGLAFAIDYATAAGHAPLFDLCREKALDWFAADTDYPARIEPSGSDFLSPALVEADLMRRVLDAPSFATWLRRFLPQLADGQPATLFTPAQSGDASDPQMVHLDGLNLSRAWCMNGIAGALSESDPRRAPLLESARAHLAAGLAAVHSGDYMGEHWLATFAVHALT